MSHLRTLVALVAVLLVLPVIASAQDGNDALRFLQQLPGLTAQANGIAGTGVAGRADASAFRTNPAGLGWNESSWFAASLANQNTTDSGFFTAPGSSVLNETDVSRTGLASLSYAYRVPTLQGTLVVGAGFNQTASYSRSLFYDGTNNANSLTDFLMPLPGEFELDSDAQGVFPTFFRDLSFIAFETFAIDLDQGLVDAGETVPFLPAVSAGTIGQSGFVEEGGRSSELNFAGAIEVSKDVMVGVAMNIPFGSYEFDREHFEDDFQNDNDGFGGTTDFNSLTFSESFTSDMVGVNLRTGVSAKVGGSGLVGLSIESPTYLSVEETYSTYLNVAFDNGDSFTYGDGITETAGSGSFDYTIISPWKVGLGGAYTVSGLTLMGDVEWVDWSQLELDSDEYAFDAENQDIRRAFDAVLNLRVGAEFEVNGFTVRAGFANNPDPRDSSSPVVASGVVDRAQTHVSAGFGYAFSPKVAANISWTRSTFDDEFSPYTEVANAPVVSEEITRDRVLVGFTFGF